MPETKPKNNNNSKPNLPVFFLKALESATENKSLLTDKINRLNLKNMDDANFLDSALKLLSIVEEIKEERVENSKKRQSFFNVNTKFAVIKSTDKNTYRLLKLAQSFSRMQINDTTEMIRYFSNGQGSKINELLEKQKNIIKDVSVILGTLEKRVQNSSGEYKEGDLFNELLDNMNPDQLKVALKQRIDKKVV